MKATRLGAVLMTLGMVVVVGARAAAPRLEIAEAAPGQVRLHWTGDAAGYVLETSAFIAPTAWTPVAGVPSRDGDGLSLSVDTGGGSRFFRLRSQTLTRVRESSPAAGDRGVAVTRETVVRFTRPLAPASVLTPDHFFAGYGGRRLLSRAELASDRMSATLFYLEPLPGNTRISVVFDSAGLSDVDGLPVDGDGDGVGGGRAVFSFDTVSLTPVAGTVVFGRVLASELAPGPGPGTNGVNRPLQGVTVTVDGAEERLRAVTDAQGNFRIDPAPAGTFFVHIDGRTAAGSQWPDGAYYPFVGKAWEGVPGRATPAAGTGEIFLPLIPAGTLQPVSTIEDTLITFPPVVLAAHPDLAGVSVTVPANALYGENGTRGGRVGLAPVPPDRLPGPLPPGLSFPLVITVQTDGPGNFDRPVPACFPNLPDPGTGQPLPPGAKSALWSFNHDTGEWEVIGPMTVSGDGRLICTDAGVGIRQPGWHGSSPGCRGTNAPPQACDCDYIRKQTGEYFRDRANTPAAGYAFQVACVSDATCHNLDTFGGGFVKDVICEIAAHPKGIGSFPEALDYFCSSFEGRGLDCEIALSFGNHYLTHLLPLFLKYCDRIDRNDHAAFFANAVVPCLQANAEAGYASPITGLTGPILVPASAALLREIALAYCDSTPLPPHLQPIGFPGAALASPPRYPDLPPPVGREQLFSPELATNGTLRVEAADGSYFLPVGATVPLRVLRINADGSTNDVTTAPGTRYLVGADPQDATITPEGGLHILGTQSSLPGMWPPLIVMVSEGGTNFGYGQFAVTDVDTDHDLIVDSYERRVGLDPLTPNAPDADADGDGLPDHFECAFHTDPLRADTDGDGVSDGDEFAAYGDPWTAGPMTLTAARTTHFYALRDEARRITLRGRTTPDGRLNGLNLRANAAYVLMEYDPETGLAGFVRFRSPEPGVEFAIPTIRLMPPGPTDPDLDGDGLSRLAEQVLGTNPDDPDTDHDGVSDGAEVAQGTNPLDGLPAATGVIASAPTLGPALDVAAFDELVVVAEGERGVGVFSLAGGLNPILVAQVDTPGRAEAVALGGGLVAVADGPAGLAIVDVREPASARFLAQVGLGPVRAVATSGALALAGTDAGQLVGIDLATGEEFARSTIGAAVHDVAVDGDFVYVLTEGELQRHQLIGRRLEFRQRVAVTAGIADPFVGRRRLHVGGGQALVTRFAGFEVVDTRDPQALRLAPAPFRENVNSFKQIVQNGSGLGVATVGLNPRNDGTHDLWLYDLTNPRTNLTYLATIPTPGVARAVTIYHGLAFVADDASGLQVVNYLAYDARRQLPTITLETPFTAGFADEGQSARITAVVADDVQVRSVEFFLDGRRVAEDGNFPFEARFPLPRLTATKTNVVLQARATDTGGNATMSAPLVLTLRPDATPPVLIAFAPGLNALLPPGEVEMLTATFSEALNPDTVTPASFRVVSAGPDGEFGTADDGVIGDAVASYRADVPTAVLSLPAPLGVGRYRAELTAAMQDPAGNPVTPFAWEVRIAAPVRWVRDGDGFWDVAANWSGGVVPRPDDFVIIERAAGPVTVTYRTGNLTVARLSCQGSLAVTGGELYLRQPSTIAGDLTFEAGRFGGTGDVTIGGRFDWLGGDLRDAARTVARGSLRLRGAVTKALVGRHLVLEGEGVWRDAGGVAGIEGGRLTILPAGTLTAESDAAMGYICCVGAPPTLSNYGRFRKAGGGGVTLFDSMRFENHGVVEVRSGTVRFGGGPGFESTGHFEVAAGATLEFGGDNQQLNPGTTFDGPGLVRLTHGQLLIEADVAIPQFEHAEGSVSGPGRLTVASGRWLAGNLTGVGTLEIPVGATYTIAGPTFRALDGRTINNAGTVVYEGSNLAGVNRGTINNLPGATFELRGDGGFGYICCVGGAPLFNNLGVLRKTAGTNATVFNTVTLANAGLIELQQGRLELVNAGGTNTGLAQLAAGTVLLLDGGNHVWAGATFAGSGLLRGNANVTVTEESAVERLEWYGNRLRGPATVTITASLDWVAGDMTGPGVTEIPATAVVNLRGRGGKTLDGRTFNNAGTVIWSDDGGVAAFNGAVFNNLAGGVFEVRGDAGFGYVCCIGDVPTFNNLGLLRKTGGSAATAFNSTVLNNAGTVEVASGRIELNNLFGTQRGLVTMATGTSLQVNGGSPTLDGARFTGPGLVRFNANVSVVGASTAERCELAGDRLRGPANFTVTGIFDWTAGEMVGPAVTEIAAGATATIRGPAGKSLNERTLNNAGTLVWTDSGGVAGLNGAVINNFAGGVFELRGDAGYGYVNFVGAIPTFNNLGTLRKSGSAGTSRFYAVVFTNRGRVELEQGTLELTQQFTQTAEGVLEVRLAGATPGSGYGRLITGGPATLAGALSVRRMDGYEPALGEVFTPLTYGSRSGGFDTIEGRAIGHGTKFVENYGAGAFTLQVVPE